MASSNAQQFIEALHRLEEEGDLDGLVSLFSDRAELRNPTDHEPHRGREGARKFWDTYRRTFGKIHSEFRSVAESDDGTALLEWTSRGQLADGAELEYDGVSVVEYQDGEVRRFRAYFDPASLGAQLREPQA